MLRSNSTSTVNGYFKYCIENLTLPTYLFTYLLAYLLINLLISTWKFQARLKTDFQEAYILQKQNKSCSKSFQNLPGKKSFWLGFQSSCRAIDHNFTKKQTQSRITEKFWKFPRKKYFPELLSMASTGIQLLNYLHVLTLVDIISKFESMFDALYVLSYCTTIGFSVFSYFLSA